MKLPLIHILSQFPSVFFLGSMNLINLFVLQIFSDCLLCPRHGVRNTTVKKIVSYLTAIISSKEKTNKFPFRD